MPGNTSLTLLEGLKDPNDHKAWSRFYDIYSPLVYSCARRKGCDSFIAEDVVQDTMGRLWQQMAKFNYDANRGKFRSYLSKVISSVIWERFHHKIQTYSLDGMLENEEDIDLSDPHSLSIYEDIEAQWKKNLLYHAYRNVRARVEENTWVCFIRLTEDQKSGKEVANELGDNRSTVYQRKDRVQKLIQDEVKRLEKEVGDPGATKKQIATKVNDVMLKTVQCETELPNADVKERFKLLVTGFQNHPPCPTEMKVPQLLIITEGNSRWVRLADPLTIGIHPDNNLQLKSEYISRFHCRLEKAQDRWALTDCSSTNGIRVNGRKVSEKVLCEGDIIELGDTVFIFTEGLM